MTELPTGITTFLFTDIEGSTGLWERHPDAMRATVARHDALAGEVFRRHRGILVRPRGEGDSLFAVFEHAVDAVIAACELQRAFMAESSPGGPFLRYAWRCTWASASFGRAIITGWL